MNEELLYTPVTKYKQTGRQTGSVGLILRSRLHPSGTEPKKTIHTFEIQKFNIPILHKTILTR